MKKIKSIREGRKLKLKLKPELIRVLTTRDLEQPRGGNDSCSDTADSNVTPPMPH
jgi:hypothetical protein